MDKDLNDAVLAAFRRSAETGKEDSDIAPQEQESEPSTTDGSEAEVTAPKALSAEIADDAADEVKVGTQVPVVDKEMKAKRAPSMARKGSQLVATKGRHKGKMSSLEGVSTNSGKARPGSRTTSMAAAREDSAGSAANRSSGRESTVAPSSARGGKLVAACLVLNLTLLILVIILLLKVTSLATTSAVQRKDIENMAALMRAVDLPKISKLVQVKGGCYQDAKGKPQIVMFVLDEEDGKLTIKKSIVRPFEGK